MKISLSPNIYVNNLRSNSMKTNSIGFKGDIKIEELMEPSLALFNSGVGLADIFVRDEEYFKPISDKVKNPFDTNKRKFDISDFKKLSQAQIDGVKNAKDNEKVRKKAERDVALALVLKKSLDRDYGEGKYIFECIGTSPSTIARVFEFMGVETHYLPISNFRLFPESDIKSLIQNQNKGIKAYSKFLKSQGIDSKKIENSDKTYLFYDYAATGKSLKLFGEILGEFFDIPTDRKNVKFKTLNSELLFEISNDDYDEKDIYAREYQQANMNLMSYILEELQKCGAAEHGGIAHLGFNDLIHIDDIKKDTTGLNSKLYNFFVMDILNQKGLLKENKRNKVSL